MRRTKIGSIIRAAISALVFMQSLSFCQTCTADVSKADLAAKVSTTVTTTLEQAASRAGVSYDQSISDKRAQELSQTILNSNTTIFSDEMASWIISSFESLVAARATLLVQNSQSADDLTNVLVAKADERFSHLTAESSAALIKRRNVLLSAAVSFNNQMRPYLASILESKKTLILILPDSNPLGSSFVSDYANDRFVAIFGAIESQVPPAGSVYDYRSRPILSRLLEFALANQIDDDVNDSAIQASYSFGNLFSLGYDNDNLKVFPDDFTHTRSRLYAAIGIQKASSSDEILVDYHKLVECILDSAYLRADLSISDAVADSGKQTTGNIQVEIRTDPVTWSFLASQKFTEPTLP